MSASEESSAEEVARVQQASAALDRLLGHRVRLTVCALLARLETMDFRRLKECTKETDGNLGAHLAKLEQAAYLQVDKAFRGKRPVSWYSLTAKGQQAVRNHLQALEELTAGIPQEKAPPSHTAGKSSNKA